MQLLPASLERVHQLDQLCFCDPYSTTIWQNYLDKPERFPIFIFEAEGVEVGYACFSVLAPEAELLRIGVLPDQRGRGYAAAALELAQRQLRHTGINRILLEVRQSNDAAQKLYCKLGYVNDGRRPGYYPSERGAPAEDALLMSLNLY